MREILQKLFPQKRVEVSPEIPLFDMHCHALYGVDDGARTADMTRNMLDTAFKEGIRQVILTPHYNPEIWHRTGKDLARRFREVQEMEGHLHPEMKLYLGSEIFFHENETPEAYRRHQVPTMAGSRYILFEMMTDVTFDQLRNAVYEAEKYGYIPILAHIERFLCLLREPERVTELRESGCCLQTNAETICGRMGPERRKFIFRCMKRGEIHFVGTDAHRDTGERQMKIRDAWEKVCQRFGADYARELFLENPSRILKDQELSSVRPSFRMQRL